jgi:hypothetical protein
MDDLEERLSASGESTTEQTGSLTSIDLDIIDKLWRFHTHDDVSTYLSIDLGEARSYIQDLGKRVEKRMFNLKQIYERDLGAQSSSELSDLNRRIEVIIEMRHLEHFFASDIAKEAGLSGIRLYSDFGSSDYLVLANVLGVSHIDRYHILRDPKDLREAVSALDYGISRMSWQGNVLGDILYISELLGKVNQLPHTEWHRQNRTPETEDESGVRRINPKRAPSDGDRQPAESPLRIPGTSDWRDEPLDERLLTVREPTGHKGVPAPGWVKRLVARF